MKVVNQLSKTYKVEDFTGADLPEMVSAKLISYLVCLAKK